MVKKEITPRHPLNLLRGYRLFLRGSSDDEIIGTISEAELIKIKMFHDCIDLGFYRASLKAKLEKHIAKRMYAVYNEHQFGQISHGTKRGREVHPYLSLAFTMLLDGASDEEMLAKGCLDFEIDKIKIFLPYAHMSDDMLLATIAEKTHIAVTTVANLLRIYREKQQARTMLKKLEITVSR